jgi:hypothetical protein
MVTLQKNNLIALDYYVPVEEYHYGVETDLVCPDDVTYSLVHIPETAPITNANFHSQLIH